MQSPIRPTPRRDGGRSLLGQVWRSIRTDSMLFVPTLLEVVTALLDHPRSIPRTANRMRPDSRSLPSLIWSGLNLRCLTQWAFKSCMPRLVPVWAVCNPWRQHSCSRSVSERSSVSRPQRGLILTVSPFDSHSVKVKVVAVAFFIRAYSMRKKGDILTESGFHDV